MASKDNNSKPKLKTKLLKKLRKRFRWYIDCEHQFWFIHDKENDKTIYCFIPGMTYRNDMALFHMMSEIGLYLHFEGLNTRLSLKNKF